MSKTFDVLGETHLPDDLFSFDDGDWLVDSPDLGLGLGDLEQEVLGDPRLPPSLPDGIVLDEDEDLGPDQVVFGGLGDIGDVTKEAGLADLSWLEFAEQDPERLPDNPVDNGIEELEIAWGVDSRTDGISLLPNVDREKAAYVASLEADVDAGPTKEQVTAAASAVRQASRKVAAGHRFAEVAREAAESLGEDAHLAMAGMTQLKEDAGLLGRVFVRAADYPGCANGKWTEVVRKKSAGAAYVVQKKACGGCVHAQQGTCALFKKQLVASVPWRDALRRYTPELEASGRKVASGGDPREALRKAFASAPVGIEAAGDVRPHHLVAADQVSAEEARRAFAEAPPLMRQVINATRDEAMEHVARWKAKGMLTAAQAHRLSVSTASPSSILRTAARLISATKEGAYSGGLNAGKMGYEADAATAFRELEAAEKRARVAESLIKEEMARREFAASREGKRLAAIERKAAQIVKQVDAGLRGRALVAHIHRSFEAADRGYAAEVLDPILKAKNAFKEPEAKVGAYSGLANDTRAPQVDGSAAWAQLRASNPPSAIDLAERRRMQAAQKMVGMLGRWVRDGLLDKKAAERLMRSTAPPKEVLRVAAALIGRAKVAQYSGVANDSRVPDVSQEEAWRMLAAAEDGAAKANQAISATLAARHAARVQQKVDKVVTALNRGVSGQSLEELLRRVVAQDDVEEVRARLATVTADRKQTRKKVLATLEKWVRDGLLARSAADRLAASQADPKELLRVATALAGRSRVAKYSGLENGSTSPEITHEAAWKMLATAEDKAVKANQAIERALGSRREARIQEKVAKVVAALNRGLRGESLVSLIRQIVAQDDLAEVAQILDPIFQKAGALEERAPTRRAYEGHAYERAPTEAPKVAPGPAYNEADRLMRWARQQMTEGFAGRDLSGLLESRFASSVRTAASSALKQLRAKHEGLAGHVYVDADAYASKVGTTGCEKGALKHRANQIPAVLQMPRCGTCSLRVAKADGTPVCSLYNKVLIGSVAEVVEDPKAYQAEMVRLANGTDADRTASYFANAYENDFRLGEDSELDHLVVADAPSNEEVGDIFFGGLEVE